MNKPAQNKVQQKIRYSTAARVNRRYRRERMFVRLAFLSILMAALFLGGLLANVIWKGWRGFTNAEVRMELTLSSDIIGSEGEKTVLAYQKLIKRAMVAQFPEVKGNRAERRQVQKIIGIGGALRVREMVQNDASLINTKLTVWLPAGGKTDSYLKGATDRATMLELGISEAQVERLDELTRTNNTRTRFNIGFFTSGDSRNPEMAGIGGALAGTFFTLLLTFALSFPVGVLAAVYLEMFAPRNRWFDFIEININNLAAVPSVIFGLLALAVFLNVFGMPRSSPLAGGLTLSLMTLPTIIIASRAALKAVPPSLLSASMSLGATRMQSVFHHILPAAMPGILTGAIIGMAQALGETAPLLLIGMVAFIAEVPSGFTDAATALPVQVFLWADSPERGFAERAATAIIVLLAFLAMMNAAAVVLRNRMEVKW